MPLATSTKLARLSLAVIFLAALWLVGLLHFVQGVTDLAPPEGREAADAVVVLTGGTNRIETGFTLLKEGRGKKLFISGVYRGTDVKKLLEKWKQESTSEMECCVVLGEAEDTLGNARETTQWLGEQKYTSYYLVTANYHMARAELAFRAFAPDAKLIPWPVTPENLDLRDWWRHAQPRALILHEDEKYLVTLVWSALV